MSLLLDIHDQPYCVHTVIFWSLSLTFLTWVFTSIGCASLVARGAFTSPRLGADSSTEMVTSNAAAFFSGSIARATAPAKIKTRKAAIVFTPLIFPQAFRPAYGRIVPAGRSPQK